LTASMLHWLLGTIGARPIYYEYVMWPVYPILATPLLLIAWENASRYFPALAAPAGPFAGARQWIAFPLVALLVLHGPHHLRGRQNDRPNVFPPASTAISEHLLRAASLAPGAQFNGRVVTMTGQHLPAPVDWNHSFDHDMRLIRAVGNDHRTIGLWY